MAGQRILSTATGSHTEAFRAADWALLATPALLWGSSFLFIDIAIESFHPLLVTLLRLILGGVALAFSARARKPLDREAWPKVVVLGVTWMAIPLALIPIGQQWIDSSLSGMLNAAMPLFTVLIATMFLRRLPGRMQLGGLAIGFLGVVLISLPAALDAEMENTALGIGLVVLATVFYGFSVNIAVPLQQRYGALPVIWRVQWVAILVSLPLGLFGLRSSSFSLDGSLAVIALGILGTGLAYVGMASLVGRVGAARGSIAIYFVPIVALILGVVFRDETVVLVSIGGMVLVLAGAYLASRRETVYQEAGR